MVYDPRTDHRGNWIPTGMDRRYDAFVYFDETRALTSIEIVLPQTYPWGR